MLKTKKDKKIKPITTSILPIIDIPKIDEKVSKKSKKSKKVDQTIVLEKTDEKCAFCMISLSEDINKTRFSFSCDHTFHSECYELSKRHLRGSMCPVCYSEERFSNIFTNFQQSQEEGYFFDIDHHFGLIDLERYYDRRKNNLFNNLEESIELHKYSDLDINDLKIFGNFNCTDNSQILQKANISMSNVIDAKKRSKIIELFQKKTDVKIINKLGYNKDDFMAAGVKIDLLISNGYTLVDMFNMGFRTYRDLIQLNFHHHALEIINEENNELLIEIGQLVDWYNIDYRILIDMLAMYHAKSTKINESYYKMAVSDFLSLKLSKKELLKLKLLNINLFFTSFGKNCLTADGILNFCSGRKVNDEKTLMNVFKFSEKTMEKIPGFTSWHFEQLQWSESHALRRAVKLSLPKVNSISKFKSSLSDYPSSFSENPSSASEVDSEDNDISELSENSEENSESDESSEDGSTDEDAKLELLKQKESEAKLQALKAGAFNFADKNLTGDGLSSSTPVMKYTFTQSNQPSRSDSFSVSGEHQLSMAASSSSSTPAPGSVNKKNRVNFIQ